MPTSPTTPSTAVLGSTQNKPPAHTLTQMIDGTIIKVPNNLNSISTYVLKEQRDWFEDELQFLRGFVKPGDVVIDVGANFGVYTLCLGRIVGDTGKVWAFEPASQPADYLANSIDINQLTAINLQRCALTDHTGTAWINQPEQSELSHLSSSSDCNSESSGEPVSVSTLDECMDKLGWKHIDLLKIDAEGEEQLIIKGGSEFFAKLSPLVMFEVKAGKDLHLELVDQFQSIGYECLRLIPGLDILAPFDPRQGTDGFLLNLFAAKPTTIRELIRQGKATGNCASAPPPSVEDTSNIVSFLSTFAIGQQRLFAWQSWVQEHCDDAYASALEAYVHAHDQTRSSEHRLSALRYSYEQLKQTCHTNPALTRWASLARVAAEIGERQHAITALRDLLKEINNGAECQFDEPFLPPHRCFDRIKPNRRLGDWLYAAALSAEELLSSYSGFFTGLSAQDRLRMIEELGFIAPEIMRRITLVSQRQNVQTIKSLPKPAGYGANSKEGRNVQRSASWGQGYFTGIAYGAYSFAELAPNHIDFALLSQRHRPPRLREGVTFNYLELGSGMGLGLCLLAAAYPEGQFIGIDFHPGHIAHSQWLATELGLDNVKFYEGDFLVLASQPKTIPFKQDLRFEYVVAHGILSWIDQPVRLALVRLASQWLNAGGAFYCSYNCKPGWLDQSILKALIDLERQRPSSDGFPAVIDRAVRTLRRILAPPVDPQAITPLQHAFPRLEDKLNSIDGTSADLEYLCGEYGAEHWQPFFPSEVHALFSEHKLDYIGSATLPENFTSLLPSHLSPVVDEESDPTIRQTLFSIATNQNFRRDLFAKGAMPLSRMAQRNLLAECKLRSLNAELEELPGKIKTSFGAVPLDSSRLQTVVSSLEQRIHSLTELEELLDLSLDGVLILTSLLLHDGHLALDRDSALAAATRSCRPVNQRLIELMQSGYNLGYLAAPTAGHGGQRFSVLDSFIVAALEQGLDDDMLMLCVGLGVDASGVELKGPNRVPLVDPQQRLDAVRQYIDEFRKQTLPRLVRLGIVDPIT